MATKIQVRRGNAATWTSVNPILSAGEIGYESDTGKMKIGNGVAAWTARPYVIDATAYALAAHTHAYADLTGKPTLGTAAAQNTTAFATAAQGTKADTAVQPAALAAYSPTAHNHDAVYAALVHTHAWGDITDKPATFAPSAHTQAASTITDFDTEVSNNTDVAANTAARHTHANAAVLNATTASFTTADETKLDGIAAGAEVNVQSDWNAVSGDAFIANKPTLGTAAAQNTTAFATAAQGTKADTAVQPAAIANFETTTQLNTRDTNNRARANHTGTQSADTLTDGTTNKAFLATERTKLSGIATGATANATDAQLRDRATHTGAQAISTVTGLQTALDAKADDADLASYLTTAAAPELIRDTMGTALVAGANVVITPNDAGDTITIAASGGGGNLVISDTAPTPAAGVSVMWLQTNAGGVPGDYALNIVTGE